MPRPSIEVRSFSVFTLAVCLLCGRSSLAAERTSDDAAAPKTFSRQEILEQAGLWPLPQRRPNVHAIVDHRRNHTGYSVENVALETAPGCYCTGNLYRPLLRHDLGPAVLVVDDFDASRRYAAERQILCAHLARLGVTVLACNTTWDNQAARETQRSLSVHAWNALRAIDFVVGLERVDVKRIGVVATDSKQLQQIDDRITIAVDKPDDLSPVGRESIYSLLGQQFRLMPDPFYATTFTQPREPEPKPGEDREKVKLEGPQELTTFDAQHKVVQSPRMTNKNAAVFLPRNN